MGGGKSSCVVFKTFLQLLLVRTTENLRLFMKKAYGVVSKGNGECFLTAERHMSLSIGGGQAGQRYPCVMIIEQDETENTDGKEIL